MDFEAIKKALVTMSQAMFLVVEKLERQIEIEEKILAKLEEISNKS